MVQHPNDFTNSLKSGSLASLHHWYLQIPLFTVEVDSSHTTSIDMFRTSMNQRAD